MRPSPVRVRLLSFGPLKSAFAEGGEWHSLDPGTSVHDLLLGLVAGGSFNEATLQSAAIAVNQEYASRRQILVDGDEVAILPPVSGGAGEAQGMDSVALVREPIDCDGVQRRIKAGADGAVCVFDGIVRNNTRGRPTLYLDYEAYEAMALKEMATLRDLALDRFKVREVLIVHRLGRLLVGETSVLIVVAAAHRGAAFEACRWLIDTLKTKVPIWKKEQFADGAVWADGDPFPEELTQGTEAASPPGAGSRL